MGLASRKEAVIELSGHPMRGRGGGRSAVGAEDESFSRKGTLVRMA
jgi:hypothetical protein